MMKTLFVSLVLLLCCNCVPAALPVAEPAVVSVEPVTLSDDSPMVICEFPELAGAVTKETALPGGTQAELMVRAVSADSNLEYLWTVEKLARFTDGGGQESVEWVYLPGGSYTLECVSDNCNTVRIIYNLDQCGVCAVRITATNEGGCSSERLVGFGL